MDWRECLRRRDLAEQIPIVEALVLPECQEELAIRLIILAVTQRQQGITEYCRQTNQPVRV